MSEIKKRIEKKESSIEIKKPSGPFDELFVQNDDDSLNRILASLLDIKNIEMKTEIAMPLNLARLNTLADAFINTNKPKTGKLLKDFIQSYLMYMVSHDRKSREEIIHAIAESMKKEKSLTDKLTTPPA